MKNKCFIGSLLITALILFGIWNHDSVARLVSGVVSHNHSSASSGGSSLNGTTLTSTTLSGVTVSSSTLTDITLSGTTSISGPAVGTAACASGYGRVAPNYCEGDLASSVWTTSTALTRDGCNQVTIPTGATGIVLKIVSNVQAGNAIALRSVTVTAYANSICTASATALTNSEIREFAAAAAGTRLLQTISYIPIKRSSAQSLYLQMQDDAGDQGSANFYIPAYFD